MKSEQRRNMSRALVQVSARHSYPTLPLLFSARFFYIHDRLEQVRVVDEFGSYNLKRTKIETSTKTDVSISFVR